MKKIFSLFLVSLLLAGVAYAEIGATAYTGNKDINTLEEQVYIMAYNNSGAAFLGSSHEVVILDTSYTTAGRASNAVGTYFTTTTTADDERVLGVTDGPIAAGAVGKVVVRGPAKVEMGPLTYVAERVAGATISTCTTAGQAGQAGEVDGTMPGFVIGTLLAPSNDLSSTRGDGSTTLESNSSGNYIWWAWIGKE